MDYRFGFNGQEKVNEIAGVGNHTTALFWEYDTRIARRWNLDPVDQISISNYSVLRLNPILYKDPLGDCVNCPNQGKGYKYAPTENSAEMEDHVVRAKRPDHLKSPSDKSASGGWMLGGSGSMNIWQASERGIGFNAYNRQRADWSRNIAAGWMITGFAAPAVAVGGVAAVEAGGVGLMMQGGRWAFRNLILNGGKTSLVGAAGDLSYQLGTKDFNEINFGSVGANGFLGPLGSAAFGYTFDLSGTSLSGKRPIFNNPLSQQGALNIGVGTLFNYAFGKFGTFLGTQNLKVGNVFVPNVFGPSLNIGANAAGNAISNEVIEQVEKNK